MAHLRCVITLVIKPVIKRSMPGWPYSRNPIRNNGSDTVYAVIRDKSRPCNGGLRMGTVTT
jgi:hypothetical protein